MDRLVVLVLFAFACYQISVEASPVPFGEEETDDTISQLPAVSDAIEIQRLEGKAKLFSDYCITTRGNIINEINTASRDAASQALFTLFNSVAEIGTEALTTLKKATDALGNQIKNPNAPFMQSSGSVPDKIIVDGQERIQTETEVRKNFVQAIASTLAATGSAIAQIAAKKLFTLSTDLNVAGNLVMGACDKIEELDRQVQVEFEKTKQEIMDSDTSVSTWNQYKVPCFTSSKIIRAAALCRFARSTRNPIVAYMQARNKSKI